MDDVQVAAEIDQGDDSIEIGELLDRVNTIKKPALLVTSPTIDLSPQTEPGGRLPWTVLSILSTAAFAVDCYPQPPEGLNVIQEIVLGFTSPIFLGLIGIQLLHEIGHFVSGAINKLEIAYPMTIIPSPSTGILHSNTQLKSAPKNNNQLFDFAAFGPILGMASSFAALLVGLQLTAGIKTSQDIASLPHLPLEFFQLSTLTSAIIESLMGTDVLMSLDPISDNVAVHPLAIAGHVGILLNALNLLPTKTTTDGGRMLLAVNSRTAVFTEFVPGLASIYLFIQGFRGYETCNLLLLYLLITGFSQHQVEVPCRNDVDPAGGLRLPVFVATTALAVIALSPAF